MPGVLSTVEDKDCLPNFNDGAKVYGDNYNLEANIIAFVTDPGITLRDEPVYEFKDFDLPLVALRSDFQPTTFLSLRLKTPA